MDEKMWLFVYGPFVPRSKFLQGETARTRLAAHEMLIATSLKHCKEMTPGEAFRQNLASSMIRVEFLRDRYFD